MSSGNRHDEHTAAFGQGLPPANGWKRYMVEKPPEHTHGPFSGPYSNCPACPAISRAEVIFSAAMDVWEIYDGLCKDVNDGTFALWSEDDLQAALVNLGKALGHVGT